MIKYLVSDCERDSGDLKVHSEDAGSFLMLNKGEMQHQGVRGDREEDEEEVNKKDVTAFVSLISLG